MQQKSFSFLIFLLAGLICVSCPFAQAADETLTITTYYPAPYGVYNELRAKRMAIGDNYYNGATYCWPPAACTNPIDANADLVVEGNVGIGTTGPGTGLHVRGTTADNFALLRSETTQGSGTNAGLWIVGGATNANWVIGTNRADIAGAGDNLMFYKNAGTAGTKMVIQNNGNVGIGTTAPGAKLDVEATSNVDTRIKLGTPSSNFSLINTGTANYVSAENAVSLHLRTSGIEQLSILSNGNVGIGTTAPTSGYKLDVRGNIKAGDAVSEGIFYLLSSSREFFIRNNGSFNIYDGTAGFYRFTINSTGNVGIGTTNPGGKFQVDYPPNRRFVLQDDGNAVIYNTSTGAALWASSTVSSIRWKENVHLVEKALDKVLKLRGVYFDWKEGYAKNPFTGDRKGLGLIAEEVGKVFPEIVSYDKDGSGNAAALDYDKLTAALVEAIKELKAENDALKVRIEALEAKMKQIRGSDLEM